MQLDAEMQTTNFSVLFAYPDGCCFYTKNSERQAIAENIKEKENESLGIILNFVSLLFHLPSQISEFYELEKNHYNKVKQHIQTFPNTHLLQ